MEKKPGDIIYLKRHPNIPFVVQKVVLSPSKQITYQVRLSDQPEDDCGYLVWQEDIFEQFSVMTDAEMNAVIRSSLFSVENGNIPEALQCAERFTILGGIRSQHVGVDKESFSPRSIMEWYVGQFLDIVQKKEWKTMAQFLRFKDQFVPL